MIRRILKIAVALSVIGFSYGQARDTVPNISFALVGDIMLGSDYPDFSRVPPDDGVFLFSDAKKILSEADVAIGNLEGPITNSDSCLKETSTGRVYAFRMPPSLAPVLADAGFDVLNTANNHSRDFGSAGRYDTERILDSLGIKHTGRLGDIARLNVRGKSISVIGFCTSPGNYSLLDIDRAVSIVDSLDSISDIVVVTFHGGGEGKKYIHLSNTVETFLGEDRGDLKKFAHNVIDAGADIVFGHGPHIPRAIEEYKGKIIAYSLGNFCTWFGINIRGVNGYAPLLWIELTPDGELADLKIYSFEQQTNHYPVLDSENRAEKLILELSKSDVANVPVKLLNKENIYMK